MKVAFDNGSSAILPDFFIVGAPKGGTTSLHYYLEEHPQIFMPQTKESWFFSFMDYEPHYSSPNTLPGIVNRLEDYTALYAEAREDQICGDASPSYLYTHATSIANLRRVYTQQADYQRLKFIISLRNPADRAWSQYWTLQRRQEDPLDFEQAIKQEVIQERLSNNWQPFYDYVGFGMYYEQIKAYLDEFGSKRVKIVLFEDIQQDALQVCRDIFSFLGVDYSFAPNTEVVYNPSGKPKSEWLVNFVLSPSALKSVFKKIVPWRARQRIKHSLAQKVVTKVAMPETARQELVTFFEPEIRRLEHLLDRDLSSWLAMRGNG